MSVFSTWLLCKAGAMCPLWHLRCRLCPGNIKWTLAIIFGALKPCPVPSTPSHCSFLRCPPFSALAFSPSTFFYYCFYSLWLPMPHFPVSLGKKERLALSSLILEPSRWSWYHSSASPPVLNAKRFCSLPLSRFSASAKTLQVLPEFLDDPKLWSKVPLAFHNSLLPPALPLTLYVHHHCFHYVIL